MCRGIAPRGSRFLAAIVIAMLGVSSVAAARRGGSYWKYLYRVKGEDPATIDAQVQPILGPFAPQPS
jgi:hypothetical protein